MKVLITSIVTMVPRHVSTSDDVNNDANKTWMKTQTMRLFTSMMMPMTKSRKTSGCNIWSQFVVVMSEDVDNDADDDGDTYLFNVVEDDVDDGVDCKFDDEVDGDVW